jgi:hypothetical protein
VKVCPFCAEELPDEATVCSQCHKDPAAAPAENVPAQPDQPSRLRLGDAFGPDGVLPTSDQVRAPVKRLESTGASRIPSKIWTSLTLALVPGFALGMMVGQPTNVLPPETRPILEAAAFIAGLILGVWGRAEVLPLDRLGRILGTIAIALNGFRLAGTVISAIQ